MCAIVDTNVSGEVFGDSRSEAGQFFLDWLNRRGRLAIGGRLRQELDVSERVRLWLQQAILANRARAINDHDVDAETEALQAQGICQSNDAHVLALARLSGARLLFTNDQALQQDFTNPRIIEGVRGRVYTTRANRDVRRSHRDLLNRTDLCAA